MSERLEPDEDWVPTMFIQTPEGVEITGFDPQLLEHKDTLRVLLEKTITRAKAIRFGIIMSAWSVTTRRDEEIPEPGTVGDDPRRVEVLLFLCGDAEGEKVWIAEVIRSKHSPPQVGEWKDFGSNHIGRFAGFSESFRKG